MKINFKITALFTLLVTAILLLLSFSIYYFTSLERFETFKKRLKGRANNNAQLYTYFGDSSTTMLRRLDSGSTNTLQDKSVVIFNYLNKPVYEFNADGVGTPPTNIPMLDKARLNGEAYYTVNHRDVLAFHHIDSVNRIVVVVAAYDADGWNRLSQLRKLLVISLLIGIAAAAIVGFLFSRQLLTPLKQMISEVNDISSQNLSHRIEAGNGQDELHLLANTFNELLNRLQESFMIQRRFISNASHELSTPLTSVSSQLEVTLQKTRSTDEYQQVMHSIYEDVQQMRQLTKSLLEIAKTGSQGTIELNEIRIDEVLFKVMSDVRKISPSYEVELHFGDFPEDEKMFLVFGNNDLLYSSLKNIVENGCKYSPDHLSWVDLSFANDLVIIQVKNHGDVIAEEEREHIFQPFYRTNAATHIKGFGLGLALAKRIISLHRGNITVQSDQQAGTVFTIQFPSVKAFSAH
ncbi:HAMP domain-containing sensor histidine kinase [Paraflavitalea sp. CAU 1676]|uniref:HAMP domain-containing sensor histidine kinase n=1 Tax=Paraflavitalea sp. CAU 1676 TaxID=3032598 RepID=UPI0023DBEEE4|nr:HAMP domain-containing sensor histidine kinase [Paraflavitalea sp. CAU 1676]MDF2186929.1 HAMP domain-containing sensor histidine kinase [Paraflavitalea sp. CAU 1676]